jgi:hypothetical protein
LQLYSRVYFTQLMEGPYQLTQARGVPVSQKNLIFFGWETVKVFRIIFGYFPNEAASRQCQRCLIHRVRYAVLYGRPWQRRHMDGLPHRAMYRPR